MKEQNTSIEKKARPVLEQLQTWDHAFTDFRSRIVRKNPLNSRTGLYCMTAAGVLLAACGGSETPSVQQAFTKDDVVTAPAVRGQAPVGSRITPRPRQETGPRATWTPRPNNDDIIEADLPNAPHDLLENNAAFVNQTGKDPCKSENFQEYWASTYKEAYAAKGYSSARLVDIVPAYKAFSNPNQLVTDFRPDYDRGEVIQGKFSADRNAEVCLVELMPDYAANLDVEDKSALSKIIADIRGQAKVYVKIMRKCGNRTVEKLIEIVVPPTPTVPPPPTETPPPYIPPTETPRPSVVPTLPPFIPQVPPTPTTPPPPPSIPTPVPTNEQNIPTATPAKTPPQTGLTTPSPVPTNDEIIPTATPAKTPPQTGLTTPSPVPTNEQGPILGTATPANVFPTAPAERTMVVIPTVIGTTGPLPVPTVIGTPGGQPIPTVIGTAAVPTAARPSRQEGGQAQPTPAQKSNEQQVPPTPQIVQPDRGNAPAPQR